MPPIAAPRERTWTDNLDRSEISYFGRVASNPEEYYDETGIRGEYLKYVRKRKETKWKPKRGKVVERQLVKGETPVRRRKDATHVIYTVKINPRQELMQIANKSLGIRPGVKPPDGLRTRPPKQEVLYEDPLLTKYGENAAHELYDGGDELDPYDDWEDCY